MCCGTSRDRWVAAPRAPRSTSGSPKVASSEATMTSELPTRPMPPPTQNPFTAAVTGTSHSYTARKAAKQPRLASISAVNPSVRCISLMSTPALKPRPSARKITACVSGSSPAAVSESASSNQPCEGMALTGGKSTVTATIPGSAVRDVIVIELLGHFLEDDYLSKHLLGTLAQ